MFKLLHKTQKTTYTLLSIGNRGIGKTVFLAANYRSLQPSNPQSVPNSLSIETEDLQTKINIQKLYDYVAKTGNYPPATMKIDHFEFILKQLNPQGRKRLFKVRWWDLPGETCKLSHPGFLALLVNCDGCCLFIDGNNLVNKAKLREDIKALTEPILSIAKIISLNGLNLPLALIVTKCDLLENKQEKWKILASFLQPISNQLDLLKVNYQIFYSQIPIINKQGFYSLKFPTTSESIFWLVTEIQKVCPEISLNYQNSISPSKIFPFLQPKSNFKPNQKIITFVDNHRTLVVLTLICISLILGLTGIMLIDKYITSPPEITPTREDLELN